MLGKVKTSIDYYEFARNCKEWEFEGTLDTTNSSFVELIDFMIDHNALIVCGDNSEVMWIDEIRFNYTNGEVYVPYISSEYKEVKTNSKLIEKYKRSVIAYNNKIDKFVIYSDGNILVNSLYFILEYEDSIQCCKVDMHDIKLNDVENMSLDAKDLYNRYIRASYGYSVCENDELIFYEFKKSKIGHKEIALLKQNKLDYYGSYDEIEFKDCRDFELDTLLESYSYEQLQLDKNYNYKRFKFESELFSGIYYNIEWNNWTKGNINKMSSTKDYFCKYKENNFYFILKKKWYCWSTDDKGRVN